MTISLFFQYWQMTWSYDGFGKHFDGCRHIMAISCQSQCHYWHTNGVFWLRPIMYRKMHCCMYEENRISATLIVVLPLQQSCSWFYDKNKIITTWVMTTSHSRQSLRSFQSLISACSHLPLISHTCFSLFSDCISAAGSHAMPDCSPPSHAGLSSVSSALSCPFPILFTHDHSTALPSW